MIDGINKKVVSRFLEVVTCCWLWKIPMNKKSNFNMSLKLIFSKHTRLELAKSITNENRSNTEFEENETTEVTYKVTSTEYMTWQRWDFGDGR